MLAENSTGDRATTPFLLAEQQQQQQQNAVASIVMELV